MLPPHPDFGSVMSGNDHPSGPGPDTAGAGIAAPAGRRPPAGDGRRPLEVPGPEREPLFNLPGVIVVLVGLMLGIHALRGLLPEELDLWVIAAFAFVPERFSSPETTGFVFPGGVFAEVWSFVSYAFLHGDWGHVGINSAFLAAFGAPVARRFGTWRFLALFVATSAGGALLHWVSHLADGQPVVGASAAVSGAMGAMLRFMFVRRGPMGPARYFGQEAVDASWRVPATSLIDTLRDGRVIGFILVWGLVNVAVGFGGAALFGMGDAPIAWEAHFGGFLVGFLGFALFDPPAGVPSGLGEHPVPQDPGEPPVA